jgi:hypothetical protein
VHVMNSNDLGGIIIIIISFVVNVCLINLPKTQNKSPNILLTFILYSFLIFLTPIRKGSNLSLLSPCGIGTLYYNDIHVH